MNFFEQLAAIGGGNLDMTLRIMEKNGKLTLNIMPGQTASLISPIIVTGTPSELDADFFTTIAPGVVEVRGLVSNLEDVKKEVVEKVSKKDTAGNKTVKKEKKEPEEKSSKAIVEKPNLFE